MPGSSDVPRSKLASTDEWRDIARVPNLYYHIASVEGRESGLSEEEFYGLGESDWQDFIAQWRQYAPDVGRRCVEIGCGAGRLTRYLAQDFASVAALDVSADMIAHARKVTPDTVVFHQVDATTIPEPDASADGVFSVITLQHLDDFDAVRSYLAEAYRVLAPGGTIMIDLSLARQQRTGAAARLRAELNILRSRRGLRRGRVHSRVRWREYPWEVTLPALAEIGFQRAELRLFGVRSTGAYSHFWFATKPA